jgi:predicted nucleotidyltransferase
MEQGRLEHVRLSERVTRIPEEAVDALIAASRVAPVGGASLAAEARADYCPHCGADLNAGADYAQVLRSAVERHRQRIIDIVSANRASNPRLFGSVARGDATPSSDIDILIDLEQGASYLDIGKIQVEIEDTLGHRVDIVPSRTLKPGIRENIMAEVVPL